MVFYSSDDDGLAAIEAATLFSFTEFGRIRHENAPDRPPGPRLYMAGSRTGNTACLRHDVGEETAKAIYDLIADEPLLLDPDSTPRHLDAYAALLGSEAPIKERELGLSCCFPIGLKYEHDVKLVYSATPEGEQFIADLTAGPIPKPLVELRFLTAADFWAPWCIALRQGEVVSICMTARLGPTGAEAGVITLPTFRGRGFGAAATAGWASHPALHGRVLFYSTDRNNISSQRVAARLGLRFIGATLRLT